MQPFVFADLCIPSGGRMAVSGGLCGIVPVQQSISGNCVFRGVSDDCHAVGTVGGHFFLYFISGVFAACLFQHLEQEFAIGIPLFLSLFCLLLCETANVVLLANEHLSLEQFLVPAANLIVSGILLLGILKIFRVQWCSGIV